MKRPIEVVPVAAGEIGDPVRLLEEVLRGGEPVPPAFAGRLERAVGMGDLEFLAARCDGRLVGVAVIAFRPNVSAGADFASVEEVYVEPEERRRGIGRALLEAVEGRCRGRGVSYVEVQTDGEAAPFYGAAGYEPEAGVRVLSRSYEL